jgi:aldose 1-epimerase
MAATTVQAVVWGSMPGGGDVSLYTLKNDAVEVGLASYGARITSVRSRDRDGATGKITLGSDKLVDFVEHHRTFMGAVCGRFANRIAAGRFVLDGIVYQLPLNNGANSLHGGTVGFDQKLWTAVEVAGGVRFEYVSPDGEMGYPGTLTAAVTYTLEGSELRLDYEATTDAATVLNVTNHVFWNLSGDGGDLAAHELRIDAEAFTPVNENLIPTGELQPVEGTVFDFREPKPVGRDWNADDVQLKRARGFDHNCARGWPTRVDAGGGGLRPGQRAHPDSGDDRAGSAVLCWELSGWQLSSTHRRNVWVPLGILPRDAALSGLAQPTRLSFDRAAAGGDAAVDDGLRVWGAEIGGSQDVL